MPQFAVLVYATDSAHDPGGEAPEKQACDDHADELAGEGSMTYAWAFTPQADAVSIRSSGSTPGPFVPGPAVVAGVYVIEAPSLEAAVAMAARNPAIGQGGGVEVRPVHSGGPVA